MNEATQTMLDSGDFHVDLETREITVRDKAIHLTLLLKGSLLFKKGIIVTSVPYHLKH